MRLYNTANPDNAADVTLLAVKRRFLAGISPTLRSKIFMFCADPCAGAVTSENLLAYCRQAQNLLSLEEPDNAQSSAYSTDRVLTSSHETNDPVLSAIHNVAARFDNYERDSERRFEYLEEAISAIGYQHGSRGRGGRGGYSRGNFQNNNNTSPNHNNNNNNNNNNNYNNNNYRGGFRGGARGGYRGGGSRSGSSRGGFRGGYRGNNRGSVVRCYNCNGTNHIARDCRGNPEN